MYIYVLRFPYIIHMLNLLPLLSLLAETFPQRLFLGCFTVHIEMYFIFACLSYNHACIPGKNECCISKCALFLYVLKMVEARSSFLGCGKNWTWRKVISLDKVIRKQA